MILDVSHASCSNIFGYGRACCIDAGGACCVTGGGEWRLTGDSQDQRATGMLVCNENTTSQQIVTDGDRDFSSLVAKRRPKHFAITVLYSSLAKMATSN